MELRRPYWAYERWFLNMVALTHYPVIYRPFRTFTSQENLSSYIENNCYQSFFPRFSSMPNKVNQPGNDAYCYAVETIGRLYSIPLFIHNNLVIFYLDSCKP